MRLRSRLARAQQQGLLQDDDADCRDRIVAVSFGGIEQRHTVIGTLSSLFYFGFVFWIQDYPRAGDLIGVILLAPLFSAAVSALGLCLGGLFDRHERVLQVLVGTSAPLFFLGGTAWPHFMMPQPLVWLANLFPSTAGVQAFVKMNSTGASLSDVAPEATVLVVLVVIYGLWLLAPGLR